MNNLNFFYGKKVFITGHTGFKGSWLCKILSDAGAVLTGYSLEPPTQPNLFSLLKDNKITSVIGDIRSFTDLKKAFDSAKPEIVIHLAAQPIVLTGYEQPVYTFETNVMGTVNILECVRQSEYVRSFLNVTTDKVYLNREWEWGYRENEPLDGFDPYSNSKSCSELVTHCYKKSYFNKRKIAVSTARAGNVIGGGDFARDRIIPDCIRAVENGETITVRNPNSIRPYQHVLEPLFAYLLIVQKQYENQAVADCYNVGPDESDCITTGELADIFCNAWGDGASWENKSVDAPYESNFLKLDCSKIKQSFGWKPHWNISRAVEKIVEWEKVYITGGNVSAEMSRQIDEYINGEL